MIFTSFLQHKQYFFFQTKPTSIDGKHQETTETAIITTEIIKHRHTGRFQEFTEYFQRKVTIPLDMPKKQSSDNTPIRSGLRKRKREEAPVVWFSNIFLFSFTNKYILLIITFFKISIANGTGSQRRMDSRRKIGIMGNSSLPRSFRTRP